MPQSDTGIVRAEELTRSPLARIAPQTFILVHSGFKRVNGPGRSLGRSEGGYSAGTAGLVDAFDRLELGMFRNRAWIAVTVAFEGGLGAIGLALGWLFGYDALSTMVWTWWGVVLGLLATVPIGIIFVALFYSRMRSMVAIRQRIESTLLPMLRRCSIFELGLLALSAGVGEEILFRGFLQGLLADWLGSAWLGLGIGSVLFGLAHCVTVSYGILTAGIGVYLGGIWLASGNLLVPIVAHSVYDFAAFLYYLRASSGAGTRHEYETSGAVNRRPDIDSGARNGLPVRDGTHRRRMTMKAAYIEETGPPERIQYGEIPAPAPSGSEVLVRVHAVSVNPIDTYIRAGLVAMPIPKPYVVGCDLGGVVEAVGPEARRFQVGDRVWGSNQGLLGRQGTFAEYAVVDECWLYSQPEGVDFESTAAIALVGITAYLGVVRDAQVESGETVFVSGGSGGVGSAVVQMAKALGAKVITTAGREASEVKARSFGADVVINYKKGNIEQQLRDFAPGGINVWWETVREPDLERAVPLMAKRGRIVVMAGRDAKPVLPLGAFYTRDCKLMGFAMFNAPPEEQQDAGEAINRWMTAGALKANIDRVLPLSDAASAHKLQEENTLGKSGTLTGKIVLKPS